MKRCLVIGRAVGVNSGAEVELSDEQARRRRHVLESLGDGRYLTLQRVEFKHGEEFGYDGEFPKTLATEVKAVEADAGKDDGGEARRPSSAKPGGGRKAK
jgi:hypothetical protein